VRETSTQERAHERELGFKEGKRQRNMCEIETDLDITTHGYTLQHTATQCNMSQHNATCYNMLQHVVTQCNPYVLAVQHVAT